MPNFTRLLALATTLLAPLGVAAGPVEWTYTSTFHAAGQPNVPFVYVGDGGTGVGGSYILAANIQGLSELGSPSNPGTDQPIHVGTFSLNTYNAAWQNPPTWEPNFELRVSVTDTASGETGAAVFTGYGESAYTDGWPPNPVMLHLTSPTSKRLTLGGKFYDVEITDIESENFETGGVYAHVILGPEPAPEPATLALAGVGLLGVFGLRRPRKG